MKKIISACVVCLILFAFFAFPVSAADPAREGISLGTNDTYKLTKPLAAEPNTVEAWVYIPKTLASSRVGELIGNYGYNGASSIMFGIFTKRNPKVYWVDPDGTVHDHIFKKVSLPLEQWIHLTIVRDLAAGYVHCYVNGVLFQSIAIAPSSGSICVESFVIGGDMRAGNTASYKGRIKSIAIYSDVRTQDEIRKDMTAPAAEGLLLQYDFTNGYTDVPDMLTDLSGNGMDAEHRVIWMDSIEEATDYAYSFAVIGDTQIVAVKYPEYFSCIYDWILDNAKKKNIQFVIGLGDITDKSTAEEWKVATENIFKLDGVIPYSIARGNHDKMADFHKALSGSAYANSFAGRMSGRFENVYHTLTVGDMQYLILTLDYGASDMVLKWANSVVEKHPEHNVIVVTHAYLNEDGKTLSYEDAYGVSASAGYNDGDAIWEKFVSQHENIVMILSGHIAVDDIIMTQRQGVHGNTVTEMLIDTQAVDYTRKNGTGMVAMFYFSEDGKQVQVEYYSTIQKQYFMSSSQFTFMLDTVESTDAFSPVNSYSGNFADVAENAWYYSFVKNAYEIGLASGTSKTTFSPENTFTVAQALTAAANMHKIYHGKTIRTTASGETWYTPYVEYCVKNGIITAGQFANYDQNITRGDMAIVFANILPDSEYTAVKEGTAADITSDMACAAAVQKLYRAGIVSGDNGTGNYRPADSIKRSEACVIFTRIALASERAE